KVYTAPQKARARPRWPRPSVGPAEGADDLVVVLGCDRALGHEDQLDPAVLGSRHGRRAGIERLGGGRAPHRDAGLLDAALLHQVRLDGLATLADDDVGELLAAVGMDHDDDPAPRILLQPRSEEHTSELQSR